jgi:3-dehydroquinate synthase
MSQVRVRPRTPAHEYEILIGSGLLSRAGELVRATLGRKKRIALISNSTVFSLYGARVVKSLKANGIAVSHWLMEDGERYKSLKTLEKALGFLAAARFERTDVVVSLGGGVVGDLAGFAAATYHRGLPLIHMPTTLLAQVDSSVGGKTGVNLPAGKNLAGAFHQPAAVFIDIETLTTLPARERVAGWCECVKQGAVSGQKLLGETTAYLEVEHAKEMASASALEKLIASHCSFKASIVRSDALEDPLRSDSRSRKILNFGHTVAHAIETITSYKRFRHGEAVGHGMLVAGQLSKNLGLLGETELESLKRAVRLCGPLPPANNLDEFEILKAIAQDKKRKEGNIQWVLLDHIGRPRIVDGRMIDPGLLRKSIREVLGEPKPKS